MTYTFATMKQALTQNSIGLFDFPFKNNQFSVLFSYLNSEDKAQLLFTKVGTQETLILSISQDCVVETYLNKNKYNELITFFEISYNNDRPFKPKDLFNQIDNHLVIRSLNPVTPRIERSTLYRLPNPNAIYYNYMIDWDITDPSKHYSQFNRQKVQVLISHLYTAIQDRNISVYFTDAPLNIDAEKNAIQLDLNKFIV